MKCPYCNEEYFIPTVVYRHIEAYGNERKNFRCLHCNKIVNARFSIQINVTDIQKTNNKSDWG